MAFSFAVNAVNMAVDNSLVVFAIAAAAAEASFDFSASIAINEKDENKY